MSRPLLALATTFALLATAPAFAFTTFSLPNLTYPDSGPTVSQDCNTVTRTTGCTRGR